MARPPAAVPTTNDGECRPRRHRAGRAGTPVAEIPSLSGKDTAVTLDAGFVEALGSLKLTPAPVGTAEISKAGVASFPITGGNVTYYTPGTESPYVQGMIDHDGSGLSLTGGGKTVELTDFVVDPGQVRADRQGHRRRRRSRPRARRCSSSTAAR